MNATGVRLMVCLLLSLWPGSVTFATAADDRRLVIASPSQTPVVGMDATARRLPYLTEFIDYYSPSRCRVRPMVTDVPTALKHTSPRLILCSRQTADRLGIADRKGHIREGSDADFVVLDEDLQIGQVFAKGQLMVNEGNAVFKGPFE